jgi:competence protein ComFC
MQRFRQIKAGAASAGEWLVDLIYPKRCATCEERGRWVCDACFALTPLFDRVFCPRCGDPPASGRCRCATLPDGLDRMRSAGPFAGWLRDSIHAFKFEEEWARADHLAALMVPVVELLGPVDVIVPIPLHPSRLRERGYNQSALLARRVAASLDREFSDGVARTRATQQQALLDAAARATNVAGAFAVRDASAFNGRHVLLIDDVLTTGATLSECAAAIRIAGAISVSAVTIAR